LDPLRGRLCPAEVLDRRPGIRRMHISEAFALHCAAGSVATTPRPQERKPGLSAARVPDAGGELSVGNRLLQQV
jgi:hypothetical protein